MIRIYSIKLNNFKPSAFVFGLFCFFTTDGIIITLNALNTWDCFTLSNDFFAQCWIGFTFFHDPEFNHSAAVKV
ncbi:Uncharacterised protein [Klebsiella pneumoniae]|nr:hypothetical protein AF38_01179 [Klebsiella pneumoniae MGH 52]KMH19090.1 hypothetical protein SM67_02601 [Klebsiella pneumoniae]OYG34281.1 hypothetical protein CI648_09865 [Klebsiella pneumoniae subsp. pneumoniae]PXK99325.1 hypothetical protein DMS11_06100 [Klebsiella variicola]SSD81206.1 Uncharacterised protein [Klebsiella quasipneumoniae]